MSDILNQFYHIAKNIPPEYFSLWPLYFQAWHFDFFFFFKSLSQLLSLLQHRTEMLAQAMPCFMQPKAQTHLELYDSEIYRFDRGSEFCCLPINNETSAVAINLN